MKKSKKPYPMMGYGLTSEVAQEAMPGSRPRMCYARTQKVDGDHNTKGTDKSVGY